MTQPTVEQVFERTYQAFCRYARVKKTVPTQNGPISINRFSDHRINLARADLARWFGVDPGDLSSLPPTRGDLENKLQTAFGMACILNPHLTNLPGQSRGEWYKQALVQGSKVLATRRSNRQKTT